MQYLMGFVAQVGHGVASMMMPYACLHNCRFTLLSANIILQQFRMYIFG